MKELSIGKVTCEYKINPIGIDNTRPRISWQLESDRRGTMQRGYRIVMTARKGDFDLLIWDTGRVESESSIQIPYEGPQLESRTRYFYKVKVWDQEGRESDWSEVSYFETAFFSHREWKAQWINPDESTIDPEAEPAFLLRKRFELKKKIVSARIYATAAGVYELYVNGNRVSDSVLAPGWTSYRHRLQYQTYDVTELLHKEGNGIGIVLGDGWYRSGLGNQQKNFRYGDRRAALLQMHVQYGDGTEELICTDSSWKAATGPILYSTIFHGEIYDARLEKDGWSTAEFNDSDWHAVQTYNFPMDILVAQENDPTRVTETIKPITAFVTPAGDTILDMGQNMVGRMRMTVSTPEGTRIILRHAEVLDKDGNIYFNNLRSAKQTVEYIAKGQKSETYAPHFTFMGFRYVKIEGLPFDSIDSLIDSFVGEVIHTDMESTGLFECSDERINQLQRNIRWGQRGNFLDLPTDCPQRDERLGWTGDAQVFIGTALFNFQGGPFFTKWLHDVKAEQLPDGGIPMVIPDVDQSGVSAGWGDAAVICPWAVYQFYGDKRLLAEQYESMTRWIEYIRSQGDDEFLWNTGFHCGDWLALDANEGSFIGATPLPLIATAYYAYSTRIVRDVAEALERVEDAKKYGDLYRNIVKAFRREFVTEAGIVAYPTQTAYALALAFDLVEENLRPRVAKDLHHLIVDSDYHLTTGFIGTPYLCFALSNNGYHSTAVRLLMQESYPGWLYSVSKGATTIWEHWDGIKPDGSFWSDDMNSFNHYAYGAIGSWMYRKIAGLDMDESQPAFKRILIEPLFGLNKLSYAKASYRSLYGEIVSEWRIRDGEIDVQVVIPSNTTATVVLKGAVLSQLKEGERLLNTENGIQSAVETSDGVKLYIGSGKYRFTYPLTDILNIKYTYDTRLDDLLTDEDASAVLRKHIPELFYLLFMLNKATLHQVVELPLARVTRERMDAALQELNAL